MTGYSIKWKIWEWIVFHTENRFLYAILILVCCIYPLLARWWVNLFQKHDWISSFVEVSIAVNSSLLVTDVRKWFVKTFRAYNWMFGNIVASRSPILRNDKTLARLRRKMRRLESPFVRRLQTTVRWFAVICFVCIVAGAALLLSNCPKSAYWAIPLLLWPFWILYAFLSGHLIWALGRSRQYCLESIQEKADIEDQQKQIAAFVESIPSGDSEDV